MTEIEEKSRVYTAVGDSSSIGVSSNICPFVFLSSMTIDLAEIGRAIVYIHNNILNAKTGDILWL